MTKTKIVICPYCGNSQPVEDICRSCGGLYDELSRQATHNDMGPWFIRNLMRPFQPGCSYETLVRLIERGQIDRYTILRGPTTKQFWTVARRVPSIAHLLGHCHNCDIKVDVGDHGCPTCGVPFGAYLERNHLGLPDVRPLPGEADGEEQQTASSNVAAMSSPSLSPAPPTLKASVGHSRGISSFASDDEIVSVVPEPHGYGNSPAPIVTSYGDRAPMGGSGGGSGLRDTANDERTPLREGSTARALRREIDRQRRLVTALIVVVVIAFILVFISNIDRMTSSRRSESSTGGIAPETSTPDEAQEMSSDRQGRSSPRNDAPIEIPSDGLEDPGVSAPGELVPTPLEQALELITKAEDEKQSLADRIVAYEAALELLNSLRTKPPVAGLPQDFEDLMTNTERELEHLRLREFFP